MPSAARDSATLAPPRRRRRWSRAAPRPYEPISTRVYVLIALFSMALLFGLWSAASYGQWANPLFLPTPSQVWQAGVSEVNSGTLWTDMGASVYRIVLGF